jgi:hypothetical protein
VTDAVADAPVAKQVRLSVEKNGAMIAATCGTSKKKAEPVSMPKMTLVESVILKAVPSAGITLERLAFVTKLPASNVADATMSLRLKNMLRFLPGNRVAPAKGRM